MNQRVDLRACAPDQKRKDIQLASTARKRVMKTTVEGLMATMQSVSTKLQPVSPLTDEEMIHFDRIVTSRETSTWMPHDLSIATNLAKNMRRFDQLQLQLDSEGLTLVNDRGTTIAHPLLTASMSMSSTIQALTRTLGLGASQRGLSAAPQKSRNSADATAREVINRAKESDLI